MVFEFFSNNVEFVGFVLILTLFLLYKKQNLQITGSFPFLYMMLYKTRLGLDTMKSWSKNHPNIFRYISYLSIFVGILGVFLSFAFMIFQLGFIVDNNLSAGGGLVLPIKTEGGMESAVPVFYVPFWFWLIALFVLVVVHEFAHGVIAERWKVKIKASGFAFLGILVPIMPAAFVEPDEKSLEKKNWWQKIAVFGAGSLSNFIFGFLFLLGLLFVVNPVIDNTMEFEGLNFNSVMNESDLRNYNITNGLLVGINGNNSLEGIENGLQNLSVNQSLSLSIKQEDLVKDYEINTFAREDNVSKGMIGISGLEYKLSPKENFSFLGNSVLTFAELLNWIVLLNIGIGIMNLLPLWITDGGQIALTLLKKYCKEKVAIKVFNFISFITLILIIFTLWPSLLFNLLGLF